MKHLILLSILLNLNGCAFISQQIDEVSNPQPHRYDAVQVCNINKTIQIINNENKSRLLKNAEKGLAYYFNKDYERSNEYLDKAIAQYRTYENRAELSLSNAMYQEYQGEKYDKVFMHNYKALNYLMLGKIEKAVAESRMSNHFQDIASRSFQKFKSVSKRKLDKHLQTKYDIIFSAVEPEHHPFKNPFASYIQALSYAEKKQWTNALSALNTAIRYAPSSSFLQRKRNEYNTRVTMTRAELFFDVGQSPLKEQVELELPMGQNEVRQAYFPSFRIEKSDVEYIRVINSKGQEVARTSLLSDINAIKMNEFKDKVPSLVYMPIKQMAITTGSMVLKPYPAIRAGFNLITTLLSQYNELTWSLLPQKILVASFIPEKNESYTLEAYSKKGKLFSSKLSLKKSVRTQNIYKHFIIRDEKLCK